MAWKLQPPTYTDRYQIAGSLTFSVVREETVFGDDSALHRSYEGAVFDGGDEYGSIPFGTKYIWPGGHNNLTDDPAIRDLWLAQGFGVDIAPNPARYPSPTVFPSATLYPKAS